MRTEISSWLDDMLRVRLDPSMLEIDQSAIMKQAALDRARLTIPSARLDAPGTTVGCLWIDAQNGFTVNPSELFVPGGYEDMLRAARFVVMNAPLITGIEATLDTHTRMHLFYPWFYVNESGEHPAPFTEIREEDLASGRWKVNPEMAYLLLGKDGDIFALQRYTRAYLRKVEQCGRPLCVWNFHTELGTAGHAMVPALYKACLYFQFLRWGHFNLHLKGDVPLAESFSPFASIAEGQPSAEWATTLYHEDKKPLIQKMLGQYNVLLVGGEAASHCVAEGGYHIMETAEAMQREDCLYFLEDCMSPVAGFESASARFLESMKKRGAHVVRSTDPVGSWPGPIQAAVKSRMLPSQSAE